jgi:glycine cleavage system aminomethyltransferase T
MTNPIAYSPLHAWQKAQAAQFADYGPWRLASVYSSVEAEQAAAHAGLALADLSALGKIRLQRKGIRDLLQSESKPGQVFCLDGGRNGWVLIFSDNESLLLSAQPAGPNHIEEISPTHSGFRPDLAYEVTSGLACMVLFGPAKSVLIKQLTSLDLSNPGSCVQTGFAGVRSLLWSGSNSTWILVAWDVAEYVWERLWQIGRSRGMIPMGMDSYLAMHAGKTPT